MAKKNDFLEEFYLLLKKHDVELNIVEEWYGHTFVSALLDIDGPKWTVEGLYSIDADMVKGLLDETK